MSSINKLNKKGFTLVEMLVSIALFAIVLVITLGSIMTIVDVNRKSQSLTIVMNDLNFALESITRSVKTGDIQVDESRNDSLYVIEDLNGGLRHVKYKFNDQGEITRSVGGTNGTSWSDDIAITSDQINIESAIFKLYGGSSCSNGSCQPRVLISIAGTAVVGPTISSKFHIQTTVSQRRLEIGNASFN